MLTLQAAQEDGPHMDTQDSEKSRSYVRQYIVQVIVGLVMLVLTFFAIAASDVSAAATQWYWSALIVLYALVAFISDWMHTKHHNGRVEGGFPILLHWLAVFLAIHLVHTFVSSGRFTYADSGLANALILALGTFLFGVRGNWRFCVIGAGLAAATWVVAFIESYIWVLFIVAIVTLLCLVFVSRWMQNRRARPD